MKSRPKDKTGSMETDLCECAPDSVSPSLSISVFPGNSGGKNMFPTQGKESLKPKSIKGRNKVGETHLLLSNIYPNPTVKRPNQTFPVQIGPSCQQLLVITY